LDPTKLLQKYPGRFLSLHLKDRKKGTKNSTNGAADVETNVVLGTGDSTLNLPDTHPVFSYKSLDLLNKVLLFIDYIKLAL